MFIIKKTSLYIASQFCVRGRGRKYNARIILCVEFAIAAATSTGGNPAPLKPTYVRQPELSPMWWIRLINFFPRLSTTCTFFSARTFLSFAWESLTSHDRERERVSTAVSHFPQLPASMFATRPLRDSEYVREGAILWATPLIAHSPFVYRLPSSQNLRIASCAPKWPTWHATGTKENFHLPPATETGSPRRPCCRDARRKERKVYFSEGSTPRFMSALAYWRTRGFFTA